jgi:UDP-N-acetylglucosamine--N-acetylmuramyl-(pentapeptide) pyrophosphoryl-undecaprenol N-acetylglucosamine transferase
MIAVTGGGTGGHIFPAVAVIEELKKRGVQDICWIGEKGGKEQAWASSLNVAYFGVRTGKLRRYFSLQNLADGFSVLIGILQARRILKRLRPDVLFSKGGFVSVPPSLAARQLRIPVVTHESDMHPGLATRIIARVASVVCVSFERAAAGFEGKRVEYTGNPIREVFRTADFDRGVRFLAFTDPLPVVTVLGGSLGASSLNEAVREMREGGELLFNLVHQCGKGNVDQEPEGGRRYRRFEFLGHEIGDVLAASDLIISRAGAGALYEIGFLGKPSILVPLPRSKSRGEQLDNAHYFQERGAALVVEDEHLRGSRLASAIEELLPAPSRLKSMGYCASTLIRTDAQKRIADILIDIAEGSGGS